MSDTINLNDFNAVAKQYRDLVRMKLRQFARLNHGYARRLKHDLLQEALIALWIATKNYDGRMPFHVYAAVLIERRLFRCIEFRHYLRCEKSIPEYPEFISIRYDDPTRPVTTSDLVEHVLKVSKRVLTRKQYLCLKYRYFSKPYEVKDRAQIAKRLRCNTNTVSVHYYQAIQRLRLAFNVPTKEKQLSKSTTC
jgi:RNA polymerase sigma factor (sigma-70 family)